EGSQWDNVALRCESQTSQQFLIEILDLLFHLLIRLTSQLNELVSLRFIPRRRKMTVELLKGMQSLHSHVHVLRFFKLGKVSDNEFGFRQRFTQRKERNRNR